ncbi:accessory gland protein Acp32CD [Drosophila kikkawai]|uniref:Accessory gland protein Acp32CD n=1 Tax=Drosophila kikkawai TaxID=30033 RepID=A0A6P4JDY9_DROKI|nr:accessory gland protein Acp32CD [Drosophila kikkawai]
MWRMRLLFGFVVLLALGYLPQERGVLAQKYYMNFAFNNNNPEGEEGDKNGEPGTEHEGGDNGPENIGNNGGTDNTGGGVSGADGDAHGYIGEGEIMDAGSGDRQKNKGYGTQRRIAGTDDDNDDSDSKDAHNRRRMMAEHENEASKPTDHSHHSSYEISIDDSFGGRYVRSIYESSESHGHSGSNEGSNARDSAPAESSQSKADNKPEDNPNSENPNAEAVRSEVPNGGISVGDNNEEYEEI